MISGSPSQDGRNRPEAVVPTKGKRRPVGRRNDNNIKCTIICCSRYLSCSRIQRRTTDWRPALVVDQVVRLGRHFRAVRSIGPGAMLNVPASNHLPDTTSATGDVTVPDVTWWVCLIRCTVAQADNKKNRKKEPHPCIYHRSGNVGFCADLTPVCKLSERPARVGCCCLATAE